jgi:hypothetical protein
VLKQLKKKKGHPLNEEAVFAAILEQRAIVEKAQKDTIAARRKREKISGHKNSPSNSGRHASVDILPDEMPDSIEPYKVEVWE